MTAYHKWLIRQRIYCENIHCAKRATHVETMYGHDRIYCDDHNGQPVPVTSHDSTVSTQPKK